MASKKKSMLPAPTQQRRELGATPKCPITPGIGTRRTVATPSTSSSLGTQRRMTLVELAAPEHKKACVDNVVEALRLIGHDVERSIVKLPANQKQLFWMFFTLYSEGMGFKRIPETAWSVEMLLQKASIAGLPIPQKSSLASITRSSYPQLLNLLAKMAERTFVLLSYKEISSPENIGFVDPEKKFWEEMHNLDLDGYDEWMAMPNEETGVTEGDVGIDQEMLRQITFQKFCEVYDWNPDQLEEISEQLEIEKGELENLLNKVAQYEHSIRERKQRSEEMKETVEQFEVHSKNLDREIEQLERKRDKVYPTMIANLKSEMEALRKDRRLVQDRVSSQEMSKQEEIEKWKLFEQLKTHRNNIEKHMEQLNGHINKHLIAKSKILDHALNLQKLFNEKALQIGAPAELVAVPSENLDYNKILGDLQHLIDDEDKKAKTLAQSIAEKTEKSSLLTEDLQKLRRQVKSLDSTVVQMQAEVSDLKQTIEREQDEFDQRMQEQMKNETAMEEEHRNLKKKEKELLQKQKKLEDEIHRKNRKVQLVHRQGKSKMREFEADLVRVRMRVEEKRKKRDEDLENLAEQMKRLGFQAQELRKELRKVNIREEIHKEMQEIEKVIDDLKASAASLEQKLKM